MPTSTIGQRVGAISHSDADRIFLFGFGVYEGGHVPPGDVGGFNMGLPTPRIRLDSGQVVWGCECRWGPEDQIRQHLEGKIVVERDIDEARKVAPERLEVEK